MTYEIYTHNISSPLYIFISCVSHEREDYYVDRLNLCVSIKNIKSDSTFFSPIYRIYLNKPDSLTDRDYIEIGYVKSEMPSITLHFPLNDPHSVYILDYCNEVRKCQSDIYKFQTITNSDSIDSLVHRTPCIALLLNPYLKGLSLFDENSEYKGIIEKSK